MVQSLLEEDGGQRDRIRPEFDLANLRGDSLAVVLYGSQARGNPRPDSDIDIIQLTDETPSAYSVGRMNVAQYRPSTIKMMAESGSLFVFHLKQEGRILADSRGIYADCIAAYRSPRDYRRMMSDIATAGAALDPISSDVEVHTVGLFRLGIYLLRTALYVRAIEAEIYSFDVDYIIDLLKDDELALAMSMRARHFGEISSDDVAFIHRQLAKIVGQEILNTHGSIESLAVTNAGNPRVLPLFENLLMGETKVNYSALTFPPF